MIGERFYKKALPVNFLLQVLQILLLQIFGFTLALARLRKILRFALAPVRARASESGKFIIFFSLFLLDVGDNLLYVFFDIHHLVNKKGKPNILKALIFIKIFDLVALKEAQDNH